MNRLVVAIVIAVAAIAGFAVFLTLPRQKTPERVVFAVPPDILSAPIVIAHQKGFFAEEGISASLRPVPSGRGAIDAATAGKADIAASAETDIVFASLAAKPVTILATIAQSDRDFGIIVRQDTGPINPRNLRGRRVAISPDSGGLYFLESFLSLNGLVSRDVHIITLNEAELAAAFSSDQIDAACTRNPALLLLKQQLGDARIYYSDWIYTVTWNLVSGGDYVRQHPQTLESVFRALVKSINFIYSNQQESRAIVARYLNLERQLLDPVWEGYHFELSLDQALLLMLEDQARWAKRSGKAMPCRIPNYLRFVHPDALAAVAPQNVTLIYRAPRANR